MTLDFSFSGRRRRRRRKDPPPKGRVLGTTHGGRQKIRSQKQMNWMHARLREGDPAGDHTHFVRKGGKVRKVRHTV